jgi:hypothetical protein
MRNIVSGVVVALVLGLAVVSTAGQSVLPGAAPAAQTKLSELDQLKVTVVKLSDQLASCQQLKAQTEIRSSANNLQAVIEKNYPGFTVDWNTGALVQKAAPTAKPAPQK